MSSAGVSAAYGYSLVYIGAGLIDSLFKNQYVGGWGIGVGVTIAAMRGVWVRLSIKKLLIRKQFYSKPLINNL